MADLQFSSDPDGASSVTACLLADVVCCVLVMALHGCSHVFGVADRVKALNQLHAQKVRSLMKSVNQLKAKLTRMTNDNKDKALVKRIKSLQKQQREFELVIDVLKNMLVEKGSSRDKVRCHVLWNGVPVR